MITYRNSSSGRYGLLTYGTGAANIGDEIQSLAARQFLPNVDCYICRDSLDQDPGLDIDLILNGWFSHAPKSWPPHHRIRAFLISMHIDTTRISKWGVRRPTVAEKMLRKRNLAYWSQNGPVGARDQATVHLLQRYDVPVYYSGCLTLTFPRAEGERNGRTIICDLDAELTAEVATRVPVAPMIVSHADFYSDVESRFARARALLEIYRSASMVVTSRLHCALPCLALGTPVLFIPLRNGPERQQPAMDFCHNTSRQAFLARRDGFDLADPPANPARHLTIASELARRCNQFLSRAATSQ